jgi:hypothetical protein
MGFDDISSCLVMQTATRVIAYLFTAKNGHAKWKTCCPPLKRSFVNCAVVFIATLLRFLMGSSKAYEVQWRVPSVSQTMAKDILQHPKCEPKARAWEKIKKTFCVGNRLQLHWPNLWNYYLMQRNVKQPEEKKYKRLGKNCCLHPSCIVNARRTSLNLT